MAMLKGTVTVNGKTFGLKAPLANDSKLVYSNTKAAIHDKLVAIIHRETGLVQPQMDPINDPWMEAFTEYNEKIAPIAATIKFTTIEE
ncbi:hypothetical protein [Spirosoma aerolatum]|uniref:hypothetical protein n=1 Tax=Spirosoma aerolatum TaxID=1211326 RepID=UPI0012D30F09|nr:hypothetical protein [Spirosoma aerolatum]